MATRKPEAKAAEAKPAEPSNTEKLSAAMGAPTSATGAATTDQPENVPDPADPAPEGVEEMPEMTNEQSDMYLANLEAGEHRCATPLEIYTMAGGDAIAIAEALVMAGSQPRYQRNQHVAQLVQHYRAQSVGIREWQVRIDARMAKEKEARDRADAKAAEAEAQAED